MQPMSIVALFERYLVFSKPSFDRNGLIVAVDEGKLLGFAHAGFGSTPDQSALCTQTGVITVCRDAAAARRRSAGAWPIGLLARSEEYLLARGATTLYGGGSYPLTPFYFGLYGGSEFSGILDSDVHMQSIFREQGYKPVKTSLVLHRELASFRPLVDRQQLQIRRHTTVEAAVDPPTTTWWEACIFESFERTQFTLMPRGGRPSAIVNFWNMETMAGAWGVHAVGLVGLEVSASERRQGVATYLLGESFRQLHAQGIALAEVHVAEDNLPAQTLFRRLGFNEVDRSVLYRKA